MSSKNLMNKLPDELTRKIYSHVYDEAIKDIKKMSYLHKEPDNEHDILGKNLYFHYQQIREHYYEYDFFLTWWSKQNIEEDLYRDKLKRNLYFLNDKIDGFLYVEKYDERTQKIYIKGYETKHFDDFGFEVHIHNIITDADREQKEDILNDFTCSKSRKIRRQVKKPKIKNSFIIKV
jgi:hypothetical protein